MKILTANFLTCAVKACKTSQDSYPLHFQDAELEQSDIEYNPLFIKNILPRIDWEALKVTATEVGIHRALACCKYQSYCCWYLLFAPHDVSFNFSFSNFMLLHLSKPPTRGIPRDIPFFSYSSTKQVLYMLLSQQIYMTWCTVTHNPEAGLRQCPRPQTRFQCCRGFRGGSRSCRAGGDLARITHIAAGDGG